MVCEQADAHSVHRAPCPDDRASQRAVRSRVAIDAGKHQGLELNFVNRLACFW
jgi:hypothetical protein